MTLKGKASYYFTCSPQGARIGVIFYTLVSICLVLGIDPCWYLRVVASRLDDPPARPHRRPFGFSGYKTGWLLPLRSFCGTRGGRSDAYPAPAPLPACAVQDAGASCCDAEDRTREEPGREGLHQEPRPRRRMM